MADARTVLLDYLREQKHADKRQAIEAALEGHDLGDLRRAAVDDPTSVDNAAAMLARMLLDGLDEADVLDAAKTIVQRAPKEAQGNELAILAGWVVWRLASQAALAEPYFRRARRFEPAHPDVLAFYRELFTSDTDAAQLLQVLTQARRATKLENLRFQLASEMAELAEKRLGSSDRAIEVWRSVLREDGYDERASAALERLYRSGGKWTALVELLKEEFERIEPTQATRELRITKLLDIAALYAKQLKLDAMALTTLQRVLEIDPHHEASLEALARNFAETGRWNDLLAVYSKRIEAAREAGDGQKHIELLRTVASVWVDHLGNPQRAQEPLAEVLKLAPGDQQARSVLARIHEQRRDWRALISLRREEVAGKSLEEVLALRIELARLAEDKLGDRREAIRSWNDVLEFHGDVDVALEALARLYERESRWADAAEIMHRQLTRVHDSSQGLRLLTLLGSIYSDRLRSRDDAIRVWEEVLRISPGHDKATRTLRDSYIAAGRWDALEDMYAKQSKLAALVDVLQGAADRIHDVEARVALYRRVASLCKEQLGQPERAQKALERTLAIQPDNLAVARELLPIYREQTNWARFLATHEVLLKASHERGEQLELIAEMRAISDEKLHSPALTFQWSAHAYRIAPLDQALRAQLESAAEQADAWDDLTEIFETRIADASVDQAERIVLLEKLAIIARDKLFKPDDAQKYFRRIIGFDPSNATAMSALEDIYSSTRRWEDLSDVYGKRLEVTQVASDRLVTLRALAKIQEEHLADLDSAVRSLESVLDIQSDDLGAVDGLARIHRNRGNWGALALVLERKLDLTATGPGQVPTIFELAQIHATRLGDPEHAISGFLRVLEFDPVHRQAVSALEALRQSEPSTSLPIMRGLLSYYRRVQDRVREAEAMEVIVAAEQDAKRKLELSGQLANVYERMPERRSEALRIRGELFLAQPDQWEAHQALVRLGKDLGRMDEVVRAFEGVLARLVEAAKSAERDGRTLSRVENNLRRDILLELGAMYRDHLARVRDAERCYAEVLEYDEMHQGAYEALGALLRARNAQTELMQLYRRRADVVFNQREQKELLGRIIDIARNVNDRAVAIRTAEELIDLVPDDRATVELLAALYAEGNTREDQHNLETTLGRWSELVDELGKRHQLACRRAALRMQYLGDAFGAVDLLGTVLGENPDHVEARVLLEELLDISEVQLSVAALLEPIYKRVGDHRSRIRVLKVRRAQAESQGSLDEAVGQMLEMARILELELHDADGAFEVLCEAYSMDPRRLDSREEINRVGLALGKHRALIELWRSALAQEHAMDRALRIGLTRRIAVLLDEHLHDSDAARQAYADLIALDPPDAAIAHMAASALCRLHLEAGDGLALVEAQRELLRFTDDVSEQVRIRLEIATIQEQQLGDRVGSGLTYGEVLDLQPDNLTALEALERLFLEEEEWERLCEILLHRIQVTTDVKLKAQLWRQLGEVRRDQLGNLPGAVEAFQSILELKVGRDDTAFALGMLVALQEKLERWADVEESLRRLVVLSERDRERAELLTRTADVVGRRLERAQDGLDLLKRVLDLTPTDIRARSLVTGYLERDTTRERAIRILTPLYEAEQNWSALLGLEELQARHQPSGRRRLQALMRVAKTLEERLQDPMRAFGVLCEAMIEAADQPELATILDKVERLGAAPERAEAMLSAYASAVDRILDADLQRRVLRSSGQVALTRLARLDRARQAFERVLELSPDDPVSTDALEQIYVRQDDQEALAQLLARRAERSSEPESRDRYLIRAAEIHRTKLDRMEDAIRTYERLSPAGMEKPEVQAVLEPLYEATNRFRELAAHLNRKLVRLQGKALVETHLRLGRLYGGELHQPEEGIRHLSAALRLDPDHALGAEDLNRYLEDTAMRSKVADILEPVFTAIQDWPRLVQIQEIKLAEANDPDTRIRCLLRMAQIQEEQLEDLDHAFDGYARVFKEQPANVYVRDQLHRLAGVLAQLDRYAALLTDWLSEEGGRNDSDEVLEIVREAAEVWAGPLHVPERAVPLYERLWAARPDGSQVFHALESVLTRAGMWRKLIDAYWREADATVDQVRQVEILVRLANVANETLEDPSEAIRAFQRVLDIRPDLEFARARLEQLLARAGKHHDLLDLLRDRLARTDGIEQRVAVLRLIADLQHKRLGDTDGAIDSIETLLSEHADSPQAVEALEGIAEAARDKRGRVFTLLRPIYERLGKHGRLVEIEEWQLGVTEDATERHELYRRIASLQASQRGGAEQAYRTLTRALCEPGPDDVLHELDRHIETLADTINAPGALSRAMVAAADGPALAQEADRRIALLVRAAQLQLQVGDPALSANVLTRALELAPRHAEALTLLDDALVRLGYHEQLRGVLERRIEVASEDATRVELSRRLALLLEETLGLAEQAEHVWRALLELAPNDAEALQRLSRVYEASGSTTALVDVLERQIEASADPGQRRGLRLRLAGIHREAEKNRRAEIDVLRALLADSPGDDDALAALARALNAEERHAEAADVIEERARLAESDERKVGLLLEVARLYSGPIGDRNAAIERYASVLSLAPGQDAATSDLVELSTHADTSEHASALIRPQLEANGRWQDLARVLEARALLSHDSGEVVRAWKELADLRVEQLDDIAGGLRAMMALANVVTPDRLGSVLAAANALAVRLGEAQAQIQALSSRAEEADRETHARMLYVVASADLAENVLNDPAVALRLLVPLLDAELVDRERCDRIDRLALATGNAPVAARALREAVRHGGASDAQATLLVRLGDAERTLEEIERATDAYRDALALRPGDPAAIAGLERILAVTSPDASQELLAALESAYQGMDNKSGLAEVTRIRITQASESEQPGLLEALARLCEGGGGTALEALDAWGAVLAHDAEAGHALDHMVELTRSGQLTAHAVDLMLAAIHRARARQAGFSAVALRCASMLARELHEFERATSTIDLVLAVQLDHLDALELLVQVARDSANPTSLHDALSRSARAQANPDAVIAAWKEAAEVAETQLGRPDMAIEDLQHLIALDEGNAAAWQRLLALLSAAASYEALAVALARRVTSADDGDEQRELRYRLANLLVDKLDRVEDAIVVYREMLGQRADDVIVLHELEVLLRRLQRWPDVQETLERKLEVSSGADRITVLEEMARLAEERLEDVPAAIELYQRLLGEAPTHEPSQLAVERLMTREQRWQDLADVLAEKLKRVRQTGDTAAVRSTGSRLAELLVTKLHDGDGAQSILQDLLEVDPTYVPAILALASVYEARGDEGAMRLTLQRAEAQRPTGSDGALLELRFARISRDDAARYRTHLERAIQLDPSNMDAARELLELSRGEQRWDQVAYLLELIAGRTSDEKQRRELTLERVDLLMNKLSDPEGALRVLASVYEQVQEDIDVNQRIADALFACERYSEASGMYEWLLEVGRAGKRSKVLSHYLTRLADIAARSGDRKAAVEQLKEAYRIDTTNVETMLALGGLHEQEGSWQDALKIYRAMLLQNAEQSGLLRRGDIYLRLANAHIGLGEKPKAQAMLRRGNEEDPAHPELPRKLADLEIM